MMTAGADTTGSLAGEPGVRLVPSNGHELAVRIPKPHANGPNVAFIHGITGDVSFWDHVIPDAMKQNTRWASFSLPCHNPSITPKGFGPSDVSPEMFAKVIGGAIREVFDGERVHLVGWSTGGFSSLLVAALHPELVSSVTSISGFVRGNWGSTLGMMQRTARLGAAGRLAFTLAMKGLAGNEFLFKTIFAAFSSDSRAVRSKSEFTAALVHLREGFSALDFRLVGYLFAGLRKVDASQLVRNIIAPTLVFGGVEDPIIRIGETQHIASLIKDCDLVELPDCGHLFYCEAADRIWPRVDEWIRRHG